MRVWHIEAAVRMYRSSCRRDLRPQLQIFSPDRLLHRYATQSSFTAISRSLNSFVISAGKT